MKQCVAIFLLCIFYYCAANCQEPADPSNVEEQVELAAGASEQSTQNDEWLQQLEEFHKNQIDLNTTSADELSDLLLLQPLQIASFFQYRKLMGRLIDLHELQAIPGWDIQTIKSILPYVKIGSDDFSGRFWKERITKGEKVLLMRISRTVEISKGFIPTDSGNYYLGSPYKLLFRYNYNYKNLLRFGIVGDKDAGEPLDFNKIKLGIDFYSLHFFLRKMKWFKAIAFGDYTVNMGQGLLQWQSFAFKKSTSVISCKRQGETLLPYTSSGEFSFNRGAAFTTRWNSFEATAFVSSRKLSANIKTDEKGNAFVSSILTGGYHRTIEELADRNQLAIKNVGGNLKYINDRWQVGVNGVAYSFSIPIQKNDKPYNAFALKGKSWWNYSFDYSFTVKNTHSFGEFAIDKNANTALVAGMIASLDAHVDVAFVYRKITPAYQAMFANAFTERTNPSNETGFYSGISIKPSTSWSIESYIDIFRFPWLTFNVDAPSYGKEAVCKISWQPNKQVEIYSSIKYSEKPVGVSTDNFVTSPVAFAMQKNWRMNISYQFSKQINLQSRVECTQLMSSGLNFPSNGWVGYSDISYKPSHTKFSGNFRFAWFETQDYASRLFAYENDVQYSFTVSQLYGSGCRYYINLKIAGSRKVNTKNEMKKIGFTGSLKWSQTFYTGKTSIGSALDEIDGSRRSDIRFQLILVWQ
jgi:hypothetical protein